MCGVKIANAGCFHKVELAEDAVVEDEDAMGVVDGGVMFKEVIINLSGALMTELLHPSETSGHGIWWLPTFGSDVVLYSPCSD